MISNVLPLHFAPSQATSSQSSNVYNFYLYWEVNSLKPSQSESPLNISSKILSVTNLKFVMQLQNLFGPIIVVECSGNRPIGRDIYRLHFAWEPS